MHNKRRQNMGAILSTQNLVTITDENAIRQAYDYATSKTIEQKQFEQSTTTESSSITEQARREDNTRHNRLLRKLLRITQITPRDSATTEIDLNGDGILDTVYAYQSISTISIPKMEGITQQQITIYLFDLGPKKGIDLTYFSSRVSFYPSPSTP
jgi:hypothetical protein